MAYNKTIWENLPSTNTPINKDNLNKIENQLKSSQNEIDNIIESGSNANGNYIKYSDGTMICYGRASMSFALSIDYGSVYRADIQKITLPKSFIDTNYRIQLQALAPVHVCYAVDTDKTINSFKFYPVAFVSQKTVAIRSIDFVAFGRWK